MSLKDRKSATVTCECCGSHLSVTCTLCWHKPVITFVRVCSSASTKTKPEFLFPTFPTLKFDAALLLPRFLTSYRDELEGVYEVVRARVHQAWLPSDSAGAGLNWVCVTSRIAGRGQAGGRVGWVTLMHPGSVGFFHQTLKYTCNAHTQGRTQTHVVVVSLLFLLISLQHTHIQTSSWRCREAVSDEIKWNRGTSLLCYSLLCECCSTNKHTLMSSTMEMP